MSRCLLKLTSFLLGGNSELRSLLVRGASGTFILQVVSQGLTFLTGLLLARMLGADGYGAYAYALSWIAVLGVPSVLGLDVMLVRDVAAYKAQSSWGPMKGLLRRSNEMVLVAALVMATLGAGLAWLLSGRFDQEVLPTLWIALTLLPFIALVRVRQGALQGLQRVVFAQVPETLIRPLLYLILIGSVYLFVGDSFAAPWAMSINVAVTVFAFGVGAWLLLWALPEEVSKAVPVYNVKLWLKKAFPLVLLRSLQVLNVQAALLILGTILSAEVVGIYAVANRGAELINFALVAANMALAPAISSMYAAGDMRRLQRMITKSVRLVLILSLLIAFLLVAFSDLFLGLFGAEFVRGGTVLTILSMGLVTNAATGSVGTLLIMTGYERDVILGLGIGASTNVVLCFALIPVWGAEGAATATAVSTGLWNVLLAVFVYRRLGIHATVLGAIGSRDRP